MNVSEYINRIDDYNSLKKYITEKELNGNYDYAGIYYDKEIKCLVPKINNIYDELVCIHEITHLINYLYSREELGEYSEIIPYFNELEYLKNKNPRLLIDFFQRKKGLIYDDIRYYYGYSALALNHDIYDIDYLNKLNKKRNIKNKLKIMIKK